MDEIEELIVAKISSLLDEAGSLSDEAISTIRNRVSNKTSSLNTAAASREGLHQSSSSQQEPGRTGENDTVDNAAILREIQNLSHEVQKLSRRIEVIEKTTRDNDDAIRNFRHAYQVASSGEGYVPAPVRYRFPGRALLERPEDREEMGLFF